MKQRLRYIYSYEKGLNRGKICEKNKPNKIEIRIRVSGQMPTYPNRGLRTHAYDMHVWDCSKTLTQKQETEKQSRNKNPNSNNQTCSKHKKNYKTNLNKHA